MPIEVHARLRRLAALRNGFLGALALVLSCESPDGSGLFEPLGSNPPSGGGGSGAAAGSSGAGVGGGGAGEGQGGSLEFAGSAGLGPGGTGGTAEPGDGDAGPDAGPLDGGVADASPEPPPCIPETEICDGLDNDCDDAIDEAGACEDDCFGVALELGRYMFCPNALDRENALDLCADAGMRLLWLESPEESEALVAALAAANPPLTGNAELLTHLGGSDEEDEGEWFWIGGSLFPDGFQFWEGGAANDDGQAPAGVYANFVGSEPNDMGNEDCALMTIEGGTARQPGQWDDRSCEQEFSVTCEVP